jgi:protein-glutamine gamma-glutamyltransferase
MSILEAIRRANRPGPPEDSIAVRMAAGGAVLTGIAACRAEGELSVAVAAASAALVVVGMVFSYDTRRRPLVLVKPVLALAVVVAFIWFFVHISSGGGVSDISQVESPLAVLFVWVQVTHAFDVPARRDLAFSLAGSASLMAVAAAQAIDLGFAGYVLVWIAFSLWGLIGMWTSASEGGRLGPGAVAATLVVVAVVTLAALVVLPAPHVSGNVAFPSTAAGDSPLGGAGALAGDSGNAAEPARPGTSAGRSRVGGYLGFAGRLDTALRAPLGNQIVMRVRAERPSYWIGETYDTWNGQAWIDDHRRLTDERTSSPFTVETSTSPPAADASDLQTFYIAQGGPNLLFHAAEASQVWFPSRNLFVDGDDSTIISPLAMGDGTIYTVASDVAAPTAAELRSAPPATTVPGAEPGRYTQLPRPYPHVHALTEQITADDLGTYAKVEGLIAWMGAHTRYSTDIPPLAPGQDTVDAFLFGSRTGYCEQISTSLAVMLRSLGIPAREAVGYVPGPYNPITDLYEVQAKDAHAWVQVWFPGYGWQSFDPTAVVPLANPSPGSALLGRIGHGLHHVPLVPIGVAVGVVALAVTVIRIRRRRPATWAEALTRRIERAGARSGRRRRPEETLAEYAGALDARAGDASGTYRALAWLVEMSAYGEQEPDERQRRQALALAARHARTVRRPRQAAGVGGRRTR